MFLDVKSRLDVAAAQLAAREAVRIFSRAGDDIGRGLGASMSRAFGALDGSAARREMQAMQAEYMRTAEAEEAAARRMVTSMGQVEVAQKRLAELTDKYGADSSRATAANVALVDSHARAAKAQRDHVDAMVAAEGAHRGLGKAAAGTADSLGRLQRISSNPVVNAVGIASVAGVAIGLVSATDAAGDFQASLEKLHAVTGESAGNLKVVSDGVLRLSGQVGYTSQELINGMSLVEKAGYRGADGIKVLTVASQLASVEGADLNDTINAVTTSMHDFHVPVDQAADVTSKLNTAVGLSKVPLQDFAGALHSLEPIAAGVGDNLNDVYASLAMLTQSGMSADQASQNLAHAFSSLAKPTQQMRDEMGALGLDWRDIQQHLGDRGIIGTSQMLHDAVTSKLGPSGQVMLDTWYKSQSASDSANQMMAAMPPQVRAVADAINNGTLSYQEFRKTRGGLDVEQANEVNQWMQVENKVKGFNQALKSGQGDVQGTIQALALLVGGQDNLRTILQLTGENQQKANDALKQTSQAHADAAGKTKGFSDSQKTYNAQMQDFKGALGAARIELGQDFLPAMTSVVHALGDGARWLSEHKQIMDGLVITVGGLGTAYLGLKTALGFQHLVDDLKTSFLGVNTAAGTANTTMTAAGPAAARGAAGVDAAAADEVAAEERVTAAAGEADTALAGGGRLSGALRGLATGGVVALGSQIGGGYAQQHTSGGWHTAAVLGTDIGTGAGTGAMIGSFFPGPGTAIGAAVGGIAGAGLGIYNQIAGHSGGGPLSAPGPKGHDSALFWGADGEHVLTHEDVQAMGGHPAVHAFRNALHRAGGGPIGDPMTNLYREAQALNGGAYVWGSTDCSGAVSKLVDAALGTSGRMSTATAASWLASKGFQPGFQPGALNIGWYNGGPGGGHMAATLPDGTHFESGGQHGGIMLGGRAAGAESSEFTSHMFLPLQGLYPDGPAGGGGGGYGGMGYGAMGAGGGYGGAGMGGFGGAASAAGGAGGYYTPNPQGVAAAQEQLTHLDAQIKDAEERRDELKADAKQSDRDRLDEEIRHLHAERDQAEDRLAKAQQGTFHAGAGGSAGGLPGGRFGVPLPANFGLNKGLAGLAEWVVDFLGDMAVAPIEATMMASAGMGGAGGAPGGYADLGDVGTPFTASAYASPYSGGGGFGPVTYDVGGGAGGGDVTPVTDTDYSAPDSAGGDVSTPAAPSAPTAPSGAPGAPPAPSAPNFYKDWYPVGGGAPAPAPAARRPMSPWEIASGRSQDVPVLPSGGGTNEAPGSVGDFLGATGRWLGRAYSQEGHALGGVGHWLDQHAASQPLGPNPGGLGRMPINKQPGMFDQPTPGPPPPAPPTPQQQREVNRVVQGLLGKHFSTGGAVGYYDSGGSVADNIGQWANDVWNWSRHPTGWRKSVADTIGIPDPADHVSAGQSAAGQTVGMLDDLLVGLRGGAPGFSTGGPIGTDTVPAWLTPGEEVEQTSAVQKYGRPFFEALNQGRIDPTSIHYYSPGGKVATDTAATAPAPAPPPKPPQPQPKPNTGAKSATPAQKSDDKPPQTAPGGGIGGYSGGSGGSKGLGIQGGALGAAEGAAAMGADAFAPGSGAAVQMASQLMNRTIAYGGQMAAIGVQGIMSTFLPSDSPLSDFGNTLPGKLLTGISGAKPNKPPTAGATQAPLKDAPGATRGTEHTGQPMGIGMQINGMTVQAPNAEQFKYSMAQQQQMHQQYALQAPMNMPPRP